MIRIRETARTLPFFRREPLTDLPLIYERGHLFPCSSYGDRATIPVRRAFRFRLNHHRLWRRQPDTP